MDFIINAMIKSSYIIAGPTASGKSDFAHALAKRVNGVVINCDSVQVYQAIENISASPLAGKEQGAIRPEQIIDDVPYKLFSVLPLTEQISVADYLEMARTEYDAAISAGKTPVFVGGTGYYINVLVNGISQMPDISHDSRRRAREMVKNYPDAVRGLLPDDFEALDPQRTARALEVFLETGRPLSEWQSLPRTGAVVPNAFKILINPPRDILMERISARIPKMLDGGAMDEARAVIESGWDENRAIGASELCKLLRGEINEKTAIYNWITRTNQYAKRQRTWFRHQFNADIEIPKIATSQDIEIVLSK